MSTLPANLWQGQILCPLSSATCAEIPLSTYACDRLWCAFSQSLCFSKLIFCILVTDEHLGICTRTDPSSGLACCVSHCSFMHQTTRAMTAWSMLDGVWLWRKVTNSTMDWNWYFGLLLVENVHEPFRIQ